MANPPIVDKHSRICQPFPRSPTINEMTKLVLQVRYEQIHGRAVADELGGKQIPDGIGSPQRTDGPSPRSLPLNVRQGLSLKRRNLLSPFVPDIHC